MTDLQLQLDRLAVSLQLWREQQDHLKPAEERLGELTRQCAEIVSQWSRTGERQARVVGELEERVSAFSATEDRLHQDAAERLRTLERVIEHEWSGLRQLHEAPTRELREQAATLSSISIAATNSSVGSFERTEARLVEIESALHQRLDRVSDQLAAAVSEIRKFAPTRPEAAAQAWPIEGVVRLHNQLRESNDTALDASSASGTPAPATQLVLPAPSPELHARMASVERATADRQADLRISAVQGQKTDRLLKLVAGVVVLFIVLAGTAGWMLQRQASAASARAVDAERQAQAAVAAANEQLTSVRGQAAQQVAQAREGTARAQVVGDVLASPDLIRFNIAGVGPGAIAGQVLLSRSRGVVFSGVRLPPVPERMTYQLWLLTDGMPVTAGTFLPDKSGRVTFTADPPVVPRAVVGAAVTLEPAGGSQTPSDRLLVQNRTVRPTP